MSPKLSLGNVVSGDFQYTPPTQKIRTKTEINSIITEINEYIDVRSLFNIF